MTTNLGRTEYSRNIQSVMGGDLIPAYVVLRNQFDPIHLKGDISSFCQGSELLGDKQFDALQLPVLGRHMATLSFIAELSKGLGEINTDKPVTYMVGDQKWKYDLISTAQPMYEHLLEGEPIVQPFDFFAGDFYINSTTATIEILHQYITKAQAGSLDKYLSMRQDVDWRPKMSRIIQAKDLLMRTLFQRYFGAILSRA